MYMLIWPNLCILFKTYVTLIDQKHILFEKFYQLHSIGYRYDLSINLNIWRSLKIVKDFQRGADFFSSIKLKH